MSTISVQIDRDLDDFAESFIDWFAEQKHLIKPRVKVWLIPTRAQWKKLEIVFPLTVSRNPLEHQTETEKAATHSQRDGLLISRKNIFKIKSGLTSAQREEAKRQIQAKKEKREEFLAGKNYAIFLNMQFLHLQSQFEKVTFDHKVKEILTHELIHAFEHENKTAIITQNDDEKVNDALERFTTANPKWAY